MITAKVLKRSSTDPVPPSTNQYRRILTQYHHGSTITALYWSSATKYQQVEPHTDPVPSCINQYRLLLTQYHQVPNSTAFCWTSTIIYQPVPLHIDPVPPSINQYRPILTQYHQVPTSTASYWPSTTKYQPVPPPTDPVPPSTNQYHLLLTQCHHISTSTASYWPSTTKYQPVPTYTVFAWGLQTPAQFTPGLVLLQFWTVFIAEGVALKKQEELASPKLDGLECLDCWEKRRSLSIFGSFLQINFPKKTCPTNSSSVLKKGRGERALRKIWESDMFGQVHSGFKLPDGEICISWGKSVKTCITESKIFSEVLRQNSLINWRRPWNICC